MISSGAGRPLARSASTRHSPSVVQGPSTISPVLRLIMRQYQPGCVCHSSVAVAKDWDARQQLRIPLRTLLRQFRYHPPGEYVSKREPQIILKTDERKYYAGTRPRGKFAAKSTAWDEIEDDKLEVAVKNGRWVVTHLPAGPARLSGRYSTTSVPKNDAVTAPAVAPQRRCDGATVAQQPRCDGATERFRRCGRDRQSRSAIACRSPSLK